MITPVAPYTEPLPLSNWIPNQCPMCEDLLVNKAGGWATCDKCGYACYEVRGGPTYHFCEPDSPCESWFHEGLKALDDDLQRQRDDALVELKALAEWLGYEVVAR